MDFPGLPQRQNTPYIAHFSCWKSYATSAVLPISHRSKASVGTLYLIQFRSRWFFFFPKRLCLFGTLPCVARPTMHFSRAAARVSSGSRRSLASGDHAGLPLRRTLRNMDYTGRSRTPPLRNPQRAPAKRQRSAFCGKEEVPAPKAKVFRRKTEQLRRAPTTSAALGERFFLLCHPRIGSSVTLARFLYWEIYVIR